MSQNCPLVGLSLAGWSRYSFSVTFATENKIREQIQQKFLAFLGEIELLVKDGEGDNAYQLNFDLFPWNSTEK